MTELKKPPAKRSRKAEQRAETLEQIYDAAEELFSKHGLHGVTLKEVAQRVGVHHTLLNYYFSDKKTLFDAVFARRAVVTSDLRMSALDKYEEESKGKPTVEGALRAHSIDQPELPKDSMAYCVDLGNWVFDVRDVRHAPRCLGALSVCRSGPDGGPTPRDRVENREWSRDRRWVWLGQIR